MQIPYGSIQNTYVIWTYFSDTIFYCSIIWVLNWLNASKICLMHIVFSLQNKQPMPLCENLTHLLRVTHVTTSYTEDFLVNFIFHVACLPLIFDSIIICLCIWSLSYNCLELLNFSHVSYPFIDPSGFKCKFHIQDIPGCPSKIHIHFLFWKENSAWMESTQLKIFTFQNSLANSDIHKTIILTKR
jgi:hypothetical protein